MRDPMSIREAIVISGWGWEAYNVPERLALALGRGGWRVLYCENPASFLRRLGEKRTVLAENVEGFRPGILGHRLNALPMVRKWQARLLVNRLLDQAGQMGLSQPIVIYPHGYWIIDVVRELKGRGFRLVFACIDYLTVDDPMEHSAPSDLTLVIPRSMYHMLRARFGEKVHLIPEFGPDLAMIDGPDSRLSARVEQIPRPRLGYLGLPASRLQAGLVREIFGAHPGWRFVACGPVPGLELPNVHDIGWLSPPEVAAVTRWLDVGFMPYNCADEKNLHCIPLKLFDYFAAGLPVVSTPLIHLWEYRDLVYLGDTGGDLAEAIGRALAEPADDPRREERRRIARAHSIDEMAKLLSATLTEAVGPDPGPGLRVPKRFDRGRRLGHRRARGRESLAVSSRSLPTEMTIGSTTMARLRLRLSRVAPRLVRLPLVGRIIRRAGNWLVPRRALLWTTIRSGEARGSWVLVDARSEAEFQRGDHEPAVQDALRRCLRSGQVFYDVGANAGFFCLLAARFVGPEGRIFAFEPERDAAARLRRVVERNALAVVTVVEQAVWSRSGTVSFDRGLGSPDRLVGRVMEGLGAGECVPVPAVSLDDFARAAPPPDVIKCDVEGAEVEVFRGAARLLGTRRPTVICEVHSSQNLCELESLFRQAAYEVKPVGPQATFPRHILAVAY